MPSSPSLRCMTSRRCFRFLDMYGKNLIFKTGGVDGCDCGEILDLIAQGKIDTTPLITHRFPLSRIEEAYDVFENRKDGVIKVAIFPGLTREGGS